MSIIWTLFLMFFKIGLTSFGGGYGMMSMILDEGNRLVGLTQAEFADMAALDLICSGPVALNAATYVGYIKGGVLGSLVATVGAMLPSFIICTIVLIFLDRFYDSTIVKGLFTGIMPATGGLMFFTTASLTKSVYFNADTFTEVINTPLTPVIIGMLAVTLLSILVDIKFKVNPITLTLIGAVLGAIFLS